MPSDAMHEAMTRTTQPRHVIQLPFRVPAPLHGLLVHGARDQVVVGERDVRAATDLAAPRAVPGLGGRGRGRGDVGEVGGEDGGEEV